MLIMKMFTWIYMAGVFGLAILSFVKIRHPAGIFLGLALVMQVFAYLMQTIWYWVGPVAAMPHELIRTIGFVIRMGGLVFMGMAIFAISGLVRSVITKSTAPDD